MIVTIQTRNEQINRKHKSPIYGCSNIPTNWEKTYNTSDTIRTERTPRPRPTVWVLSTIIFNYNTIRFRQHTSNPPAIGLPHILTKGSKVIFWKISTLFCSISCVFEPCFAVNSIKALSPIWIKQSTKRGNGTSPEKGKLELHHHKNSFAYTSSQ